MSTKPEMRDFKMSNLLKVTAASKKDPKKSTFTQNRLLALFPTRKRWKFTDGSKILVTLVREDSNATYEAVFTKSRTETGGNTFYGSLPAGFDLPKVGKTSFVEVE